jgi:hypothetical protein
MLAYRYKKEGRHGFIYGPGDEKIMAVNTSDYFHKKESDVLENNINVILNIMNGGDEIHDEVTHTWNIERNPFKQCLGLEGRLYNIIDSDLDDMPIIAIVDFRNLQIAEMIVKSINHRPSVVNNRF